MNLNAEEVELLTLLRSLHQKMRAHTRSKYHRINPANEDFFPWDERGRFWAKKNKGITIYNSATLIGDVKIGEKTWVGPFTLLDGGGGLKIGKFCSISTGVNIITHDTVKWSLSSGKENTEYCAVKIGNCCFIGTHAVILKGVTIGSHCIIGAGAVVTKNIPAYSIVTGVPAKVVGRVVVNHKVTLKFKKR